MKTIISSIVGLLLLCGVVSGQQYTTSVSSTPISGGTNKAMALTTNQFYTIDCSRSEYVAMFANYSFLNAPGGGDATSVNIDFHRGISPGVFETNAWFTWTVPGNSTTPASQATNITVAGIPQLRFRIKNVSTNSHATNFLFMYNLKR